MKIVSEETRQRMSESAIRRCSNEWRKAQSERMSTPLPKQKVQELYGSGKTQTEIAEILSVSQKVIWRFMVNNGIKARVAAKRDQENGNTTGSIPDSSSGTLNFRWVMQLQGYPEGWLDIDENP